MITQADLRAIANKGKAGLLDKFQDKLEKLLTEAAQRGDDSIEFCPSRGSETIYSKSQMRLLALALEELGYGVTLFEENIPMRTGFNEYTEKSVHSLLIRF